VKAALKLPFVIISSVACDSAWRYGLWFEARRHHRIFVPFGFTSCYGLRKKFFFLLAWSCKSLHAHTHTRVRTHTQKRSLSLSDRDVYFLTVWLMLKSSVKMCRNVSHDKLLTARTLSVLRRLSTWVTWRALPTFWSVRLDYGRPEYRTRRTKHWNKRHWNGRGTLLYNLPGISDFSPISFRTLGFTSGFEYSTPARDGWSTVLVQSLLRSW
jgi:hypothetical protein